MQPAHDRGQVLGADPQLGLIQVLPERCGELIGEGRLEASL
jgi:hypothetical protein